MTAAFNDRVKNLTRITHDVLDRHKFGKTFPIPGLPKPNVAGGKIGQNEGPARSDHQHPLNGILSALGGSTEFLIHAERIVVNTDAAANFIINFPSAFPNALVICQATISHVANNILCSRTAGTVGTATFKAIQADTGVGVVSAAFFVDYLAIGT